MKHLFSIIIVVLTMLLLFGCKGNSGGVDNASPSVYYWRTTFDLDDTQRRWLDDNEIKKIYLRLFDVVVQNNEAVPHATVAFGINPPDQYEIIPTIYIDEPVLRCGITMSELANRLSRRVSQMGETHHFAFKEIQIDCDWTQRSQDSCFALLTALKQLSPERVLSSTIRLHQLSLPAPPADYGVLMLYNTGDFRDAESDHNPILDVRDVEPYLRYLRRYPLPLCAAYPNFEWNLLYDEDGFAGILYGENLSDSRSYQQVSSNRYVVVTSRDIPISMGAVNIHLRPGQIVKHWGVDDSTLAAVKQKVHTLRPSIHNQTIIYHLPESSSVSVVHDVRQDSK